MVVVGPSLILSLCSCRSSLVFFCLQGNYAEIFQTQKIKAQKSQGHFRSVFRKKFVAQKKIFRAKIRSADAALTDFKAAVTFLSRNLEPQQRYFPHRAILVAILSQNSFVRTNLHCLPA